MSSVVCYSDHNIIPIITGLAKQRGCEDLQPWLKSIANHLYWLAATSDSAEMKVAKWESLANHIQDIHVGHGELFPNWLHADLTDEPKAWLTPGKLQNAKKHNERSFQSMKSYKNDMFNNNDIFITDVI